MPSTSLGIVAAVIILLNVVMIPTIIVMATNRKKKGPNKPRPQSSSKANAIQEFDDLPSKREFRIQKLDQESIGRLSGLTVLIVDDDPTNTEVLLRMLELMGLSTFVTAEDGELAVEYARDNAFDLIFMDIQMPKMNGIDAAKEIRTSGANKHTPIVPITGFSRIVTKKLCEEAGMIEFLQKPVDFDLLETATNKALLTRGKRRAA